MAFMRITSPHAHRPGTTGNVMLWVIMATLPGLACLTYFFGPGTLLNVLTAGLMCMGIEAAILFMRKRPVGFYLKDFSALVTGVLLGLALPPYCPWWIVAVGSVSAIMLAKQLYGGMGYNPFNPAMVGYVVLLISFPLEMTQWGAPRTLLADGQALPGVMESLRQIWAATPIDGYTAATPLDVFKQNQSLMTSQLYQAEPVFSTARWAGAGWEWANVAFLLGGCFLLYKKIFTWHAPLSLLLTLGLMAVLFNDGGSSNSGGSLLFHWLSGATMLGAFFIATDPVSSAVSNKGRIIYGACIGLLIYLIRTWGNYPDSIAFAVLLMNFAAPFIDYYTLPRTYGHDKARRATEREDS